MKTCCFRDVSKCKEMRCNQRFFGQEHSEKRSAQRNFCTRFGGLKSARSIGGEKRHPVIEYFNERLSASRDTAFDREGKKHTSQIAGIEALVKHCLDRILRYVHARIGSVLRPRRAVGEVSDA